MGIEVLTALVVVVFVIAVLYSSVGQAGASGYIAAMSLFSLAPGDIRPIALALNILVATIGSWQFWRAGHFSWDLFWPFAVLSVPFAFLGGYLNLPTHIFKVLVGCVLLVSAAQFLLRPPADGDTKPPVKAGAIGIGASLGLLSGLTGMGGGIFLTPLLILMRWARTSTASAVSAPFILLNSASGLLGNVSATKLFPDFAIALLAAAAVGGTIGSHFGSRRLAPSVVRHLLTIVLIIAGMKLVFT